MDFGGLTGAAAAKQRWYGSGAAFVKQERSWSNNGDGEDEDLRGFKLGKTNVSAEVFSASRTPLLRSSEAPQGQQMLSFSSPKSAALPYYHHSSISSGYGNGGYVHGGLSGIKGPFTPSQWMELEHQALIYKYINANVPIPSSLLTPIRRALDAAGFTNFAGLRPNAFGWGAFHLGFSNSTDPEPGRCRRTDGKKWRCSRDAVVDQKYCERHMNRGRHRSRKPVEGQSGHSVTGTGTGTGTGVSNNATAGKFLPGLSPPATVVPGGALHHPQPGGSSNAQCAPTPQLDRSFLGKENSGGRTYQDPTSSSIISSNVNLKESQSQSQFPFSKQPDEFGLVCSDSLLNPLDRRCSLVSGNDHGSSKASSGLRQFMDDWPNSNRPERSSISWPAPEIDMHSDRTQLSISIPSDFMSSTSSPTNEKVNNVNASPLRLGVGNIDTIVNEQRAVQRQQGNWIPVTWESSMGGGPLAEVLHSTNTNDSRSLSLMTDGLEGTAASPTGVLQKAAFVSRSNSSNCSSPRAVTSKAAATAHDGASHCSGLLGSTLLNPALPAL